jgi:hypothetical protein
MKLVSVTIYSFCGSPFHEKPFMRQRIVEGFILLPQDNLAEQNLSTDSTSNVLAKGGEIIDEHSLTECPFGLQVKARVGDSTVILTDNDDWGGRLK